MSSQMLLLLWLYFSIVFAIYERPSFHKCPCHNPVGNIAPFQHVFDGVAKVQPRVMTCISAQPCTCTTMHMHNYAHAQPCTCTTMHMHNHAHVQLCTCTTMHMYNHAHVQPCTSATMHMYNHGHAQPCTTMHMHNYAHVQPCTSATMHMYNYAHLQPCTCTAMHNHATTVKKSERREGRCKHWVHGTGGPAWWSPSATRRVWDGTIHSKSPTGGRNTSEWHCTC